MSALSRTFLKSGLYLAAILLVPGALIGAPLLWWLGHQRKTRRNRRGKHAPDTTLSAAPAQARRQPLAPGNLFSAPCRVQAGRNVIVVTQVD
ncbi:MAG: hypothetical protein E6H80_10225 [Betaproteobacteria bacterium]|nr:MAG: hypothetical protein E6H80_10225 [Betaproteobacteria bacterium]